MTDETVKKTDGETDNWTHFGGQRIEFDDAKRFLTAKGVNPKCPTCGKNETALIIATAPGNNVVLTTVNSQNEFGRTVPVFLLACSNCGYMRTHSLGVLAAWMNEGSEGSDGSV